MRTLKIYFSVIALFSVLVLAGCRGKDGDPGPAGTNGTSGTSGTNGINGTNGTGFDDAIKKGSVIIYLSGKTPIGDNFKDTLNFRFSSNDLDNSAASGVGSTSAQFNIERFLGFDNYDIDDFVNISTQLNISGSDTTYRIVCHLKAMVATPDFRYFSLDDSYYNNDNVDFTNASFKALTYNATTGHFTYRFSFTVMQGYNSTGYPLDVTGVVNTTVYQREYTP